MEDLQGHAGSFPRTIAFGAWQSTCSCVGTPRIPLSVFQKMFKLVFLCVKSNIRGQSVVPPLKGAPRRRCTWSRRAGRRRRSWGWHRHAAKWTNHFLASSLCEECKACHIRTERPVLARQPVPLFVPTSLLTKTATPLTDDPAQEDLLQKYQERVEKLSQQNRVMKSCTDAGLLKKVEVGQYFIAKHTEEFSQFM